MLKCMIGIAVFPAASTLGAPGPTTPIVTILTGKATVIHALSQFDAAEGVRLSADDLVRTGKDTFLRIEYEDQSSIELGPQTQLQLNYPAVRKKSNRPGLYVLEGWVKVGAGKPDGADKAAFAAIGMEVTDMTGVMVLRAGGAAGELFAEQGSAHWVDRDHRAEPVTLKQGDFLIAAPGRAPRLEPRPSADFTAALPRLYRDTLPFRYNLFRDHVVVPENAGAFTYADVESWINAEPSIRRQFVSTWRRKADDPAFRAALDRDLQKHPEWDPVLHPEKFEPPTPPRAATASPTAASQPDPALPHPNH